MKRFSLFATALVALALGVAACTDNPPTQPAIEPAEAELSALHAKYGSGSGTSLLAACLTATGGNTLLCTQPRTAICNALTTSSGTGPDFTFTVRIFGREITYTVTIEPNAQGALIEVRRNGVLFTSKQVDATAIGQLCSGGAPGDGTGDDDK